MMKMQPDFATLGSFGTIADVAKTIVPQGRGARVCLWSLDGASLDVWLSLTASVHTQTPTGRGRREEQAAKVRVPQGVLRL